MLTPEFITCKTALSLSKLPGLMYSLNPYVGCEHGCIYCYSPSVLGNQQFSRDWGNFVKVKQNLLEVLERELKRKPRGVVGVSTVTDPYQPIESKLELTRRCLKLLSQHGFPVSVQTKSGLVLRDADLIKPKGFDVGVTITTMNRELAEKIEPRASPPDARANVLKEFASRGVETWLFFGPITPELNDSTENIRRVAEVAKKTGSKLIYDKLNLKRWVLDRIAPVLERARPGLAERLPALISQSGTHWSKISEVVKSTCKELGVRCESAFPD